MSPIPTGCRLQRLRTRVKIPERADAAEEDGRKTQGRWWSVNRRVKGLWIPGLLTLLLSLGVWHVVRRAFPESLPQFTIGSSNFVVWFYPPWLLGLVALGALGAYCSRRAGGTTGQRLVACQFPALAQFIFLSARLAVVLPGAAHRRWGEVLFGLLDWVVIPAFALVIGSLAFLGRKPAVPGPSAAGRV
jgi:hypothetical protein